MPKLNTTFLDALPAVPSICPDCAIRLSAEVKSGSPGGPVLAFCPHHEGALVQVLLGSNGRLHWKISGPLSEQEAKDRVSALGVTLGLVADAVAAGVGGQHGAAH